MTKKINYEELEFDEIIDEVVKKKEFSQLPREDVVLVYSFFSKRDVLVEDKIKLTRDLLRKMYTAFVSDRLLSVKDKEANWFLGKHISTKERMDYYFDLYKRILSFVDKKFPISIFDFGCGINGFSYSFLKDVGFDVNYIGTEPVGQLCDLQNSWFQKRNIRARVEHLSLFDLNKNIDLVKGERGKKVAFFFKVLDSLEMFKRDYSKEVLKNIVPIVDEVVVSWATRSLVSKKKFHAERVWLKDFISKEFLVVDEFDFGVEHYLIFRKK